LSNALAAKNRNQGLPDNQLLVCNPKTGPLVFDIGNIAKDFWQVFLYTKIKAPKRRLLAAKG